MDTIDVANEHADLFREIALRNARADRFWDIEKPLIIDDIRYCLDCEDPIPEERIEAKPDVTRCVEC